MSDRVRIVTVIARSNDPVNGAAMAPEVVGGSMVIGRNPNEAWTKYIEALGLGELGVVARGNIISLAMKAGFTETFMVVDSELFRGPAID